MKTIKQGCVPRPGVFDHTRRDTVLDLTDLARDRIDPVEFFAENHVTEGMRTLLTEGFRRLEGKSAQGVFRLTQAMGGGKTHNQIALGLLARHPEHREAAMGGFYRPDAGLGPVRVVAFSGRESDAPFGIWGRSRTSSTGGTSSRTTMRPSPRPARPPLHSTTRPATGSRRPNS